ncbi:radical SAM protein [Microbispora amethystogenes]|uniref:Radical SAM core domain-containing protein n=1 Tax=Microbispora amethystogenes TaxID=1427754 RepID=A0ABQ4F6H2_9ACTN|nr:radical SAM protein [Microbispora amethystogenes]GIH30416.1 hypothetical protein Mam01_05800 [Microbispora amethystogenes]
MIEGSDREDEASPRLIRGERGWWFLGPGGIARLGDGHLTPARTLRPDVERGLREQGLFTVRPSRSYSLTVLTATACNLGCAYCFQNVEQDDGGTRPPRIASVRLTSGVIAEILDFVGRRQAESGLDGLVLTIFGGEPLLNPRGCRELLERAAGYGLRDAVMVSNGTLLTARVARQLAGLGLRSVQVTFDGDRPDHDRIRVRRTGGGTFDAIVGAMAAMTEATSVRCDLRVNVSARNVAGIDALVERLAAGLDPARCSIHFARVGDAGVGYEETLAYSDDLADRFIRWQRRALDLGFAVPRPHVRRPCNACSYRDGKYGAVVNPDGGLYSSWTTAGRPGWRVGTARDGYLPRERTEDLWATCEDTYGRPDDTRAAASFRDRVDAAHLDHLSATGRLRA